MRAQAKGSGWKSITGSLFRETPGKFIEVMLSVHIDAPVTQAIIAVKPMTIDPIFWDIVGLPENNALPLSFRANGAWICRAPYSAEITLEESSNPAGVARDFFVAANEQLAIMVKSWTVENLLQAAFCPALCRR